jgi:chemotaxis protein MotA
MVIVPRLKKYSSTLRKKLQGTIYLPIELILEAVTSKRKNNIDLHELQELREKEVFYYHIFDTINSIFPLMGILGTIIGLLGMVGMDSGIVMSNFTIALTSTFWGLVFSIGFKAFDGILAPDFYQNQENLQLIYERMDTAKREEHLNDKKAEN